MGFLPHHGGEIAEAVADIREDRVGEARPAELSHLEDVGGSGGCQISDQPDDEDRAQKDGDDANKLLHAVSLRECTYSCCMYDH